MAKEFETNFLIGGKVSKTLAKALKISEKEVQKSLKDTAKKAGDISKTVVKSAVAITAAAGAALMGVVESTKEYRQEQAKLVSAFEAANGTAKAAKKTYAELYRVLGDEGQAVEAANLIAKMTTNQEHLAQWTKICQGVYSTFGASLPVEGMVESANETARVGKITGSLADAINWTTLNTDNWNAVLGKNNKALTAYNKAIKAGMSQEDAFNEALLKLNTTAEREALIRTTLSDTYSGAAASYEKNAAGILAANAAQQKLTDSMAALGTAAEPVMTTLKEIGADVLQQLAPYIQDFAENHLPSIQTALEGVGEKIGNVLKWVADNWSLVSTLAAVILGIAAAISVMTTVLGIMNAVMMASPVTWIVLGIVAAIIALIAIIVLCVKHWDKIKAAAISVWEAICNAFSAAGSWFYNNVIAPISNFFTGLWNGIVNAALSIWNKITTIFGAVKGFFQGIWNTIKTMFTNIATSIANGISGAFKSVVNAVIGFAEKIINGFINSVNSAIGFINKIPGVNIPLLATLSIPRLATGGSFDGLHPQLAIVGDAPETMVPHGNTPRNRALLAEAARGVGVGVGGDTINISFAPVIYGGSGADVRQAINDSETEFERRMDAYFRKKGRVSFA